MKSCFLAVVSVALWLATGAAQVAAEPQEQTSSSAAATDAEAPAEEPATSGADASVASGETAPEAERFRETVLGPKGRDDQGRTGRLHTVASGDTLWDISDAYLGTPWVWPSIWHDNESVANPHLIHPGDILWITPEEMRPVSDAEAAQLLAAGDGTLPAAMEVDGMPGEAPERERFNYAEIQTSGFVSDAALDGSASIVDAPTARALLAGNDRVMIGLGSGKVAQGDRFTIFRTEDRVRDITGQPVGWETRELGWLEVTKVHADTATAMIRLSRADMQRGDRVLPLEIGETDIEVLPAPEVEGHVLHTPDDRLNMAAYDVVYLDRGAGDGLEVGSPLEIYRPLGQGVDKVNGVVDLPDEVVAKLLVVKASDKASVAVVTHATADLTRGDRFRGSVGLTP